MKLWNATRNTLLAEKVRQATTFIRRLKGLLGTPCLPIGEVLLIAPCNSVHTLGMRYSIDVLFMADDGTVLKIAANLPPGRVAAARSSSYVLELPAGLAAQTGTVVGDRLNYLPQGSEGLVARG
jgi:uncharacterized protein